MPQKGFVFVDWVVLAAYLIGMIGVGVYFSRRQTSTGEYFTASKRMTWFPVAISVAATMFSGISFLGGPSRVFCFDSVLVVYPISVLIITPVVTRVLLPFYRKLEVTTAYEYLEKRFSLNVRLFASALFIGTRLLWMALVALAPALALSTVTDLRVEYSIIIIGLATTAYTGLGGMSAVIWTDVIQFILYMGAQVLMFAFIAAKLEGGVGEIWTVGVADHKAWMSMDFDFARLTIWTMLIAGCGRALCDLGSDQIIVQRLMTAKDEKTAQRSLWINVLVKMPANLLLVALGVGLWVFYKAYPQLLNLAPEDYDKILPFFVVTQLPAGISGIVIAGIFAAAMSSFSSGLNSILAALTVDWYKRLLRPNESDRKYLLLAKILTWALGVVVTVLALIIYRVGIINILDTSNEFAGYFGGALLGIFLLGVLTHRAKPLPTLLGAIASVALILSINQLKSSTGVVYVNPYLYATLGCLLTMGLGYAGSLLGPELAYEKIRQYTLAKKTPKMLPSSGPEE